MNILTNINRNLLKNISNKQNFMYHVAKEGANPAETRYYLLNDQKQKISFWNDLALQNENKNSFQVCIEIPNNRLAKFELNKEQKYHPLNQDTKLNKYNKQVRELRYYAQFPYFNYGYFPQTWENPLIKTDIDGLSGDNDPLDILELGETPLNIGDVVNVKVLGSFCLIDQGEVDWKILTVRENFAEQYKINSVQDYEKLYPGKVKAIQDWFRYIKTFDGKKENTIYQSGKIYDLDKTLEIIQENNQSYLHLLDDKHIPENLLKDQQYIKDLRNLRQKYHFN